MNSWEWLWSTSRRLILKCPEIKHNLFIDVICFSRSWTILINSLNDTLGRFIMFLLPGWSISIKIDSMKLCPQSQYVRPIKSAGPLCPAHYVRKPITSGPLCPRVYYVWPNVSAGPLCPAHYVRLRLSGVSLDFSQGARGNARKKTNVCYSRAWSFFVRCVLSYRVLYRFMTGKDQHTRRGRCRHRCIV